MPSSGEKKLQQQQRRREKAKQAASSSTAALEHVFGSATITDVESQERKKQEQQRRKALLDRLAADRVDCDCRRPELPPDHSPCTWHECFCAQPPLQHPLCPQRFSQPALFAPEGCGLNHWRLTNDLDEQLHRLKGRGEQLTQVDIEDLLFKAQSLAESMRTVQDATGAYILAWHARYELHLVAAALALRCGCFTDATGSLQSRAAAQVFAAALSDTPALSEQVPRDVRNWLTKLQRLEQACIDTYADEMQGEADAATRFIETGLVQPGPDIIDQLDRLCLECREQVQRIKAGEIEGDFEPCMFCDAHAPGMRYKYFQDLARRVMKARTHHTPTYDLVQRCVAGGCYDWDPQSSVSDRVVEDSMVTCTTTAVESS